MAAPIAVVLSGGGIIDLDGTALVQLLLFFVALVLLRQLLFRPMMSLLEAREVAIDGAKEEAKDMQQVAESQQRDFEERMAKVRKDAQVAREKLREEGLSLERKVLQNVRDEVAKKAAEAEADLRAQRTRLETEVQAEVPQLARHMAARVLGRSLEALVLALMVGTALSSPVLAESGHGEGHGAASSLEIEGPGTVGAVRVVPHLDHPHVSDLALRLTHHPHSGHGKTAEVAHRSHDHHSFEEGFALNDVFDGRALEGTWTLHVADEAFGDEGTLRGFTLHVERCAEEAGCAWEVHEGHHAAAIPDLQMDWGIGQSEAGGSALVRFFTNPLLGSIFNFLVLLAILYFGGRGPLKQFLVQRRDTLQADLLAARELRQAAQERYDEAKRRIDNLDSELETLRGEMIRAGEEERARIVADAEKKAARMRKDTAFMIEQQLKQLKVDLTQKAVQASVLEARKALETSVQEADQHRLANEYLERLRSKAPESQA